MNFLSDFHRQIEFDLLNSFAEDTTLLIDKDLKIQTIEEKFLLTPPKR